MTFEQQPSWIAAAQRPPARVPADAPRPVPLAFRRRESGRSRRWKDGSGTASNCARRGWRFWERSLTGGRATIWKCWRRIDLTG